ncbi:MFS transporter [Sulfuracidifex tepidarius]|uniref:Multidrug resistance protein MdtD n=1 Tax=Sulfuracidifex tepidarius TaxID=1294262 RepID=A0A510DZL5_9CREN|nr:MFS transporter [Sulfuracidifex tepidarius]BBG22931.1 Putative multidrug resistance protein MdtD [Sulfuracidifex tepidarius]BBG25691.1 Putative multidrug resistance protein MdtD [Sulfuracidifex tepidarius]
MDVKTRTLILLSAMLLIVNYVETMVVPALPTIERDFSISATLAGWVTSAYMIVAAAASPLMGKLADTYGKKKIYTIAVGFYILAVAMAGFSPNIWFLLIARGIQGIGFSMFPISIAFITDLYPRERVAFAQSLLSAMIGIGPALGLLLGSYVVEDLGWPYAFHTAAILSLILFALSLMYLPHTGNRKKEKVDYVGASLIGAGTVMTLVYVTEGPTLGWTSIENFGFLFLGLILYVAFVFFERRVKEPLLRLDLFKIRNFSVANLVGLVSGIGMFMVFIFLVYYAQIPSPYGLGLTIIQSGLIMSPVALGMIIFGPIMGKLMPKIGPKPIIVAGATLSIISYLMLWKFRSTPTELLADGFVSSIGLVAVILPLVNIVALSLPDEYRTTGLGMNTLLRTLGGSVGPVVATAMMETYQDPIVMLMNGQPMVLGFVPSSLAFDYISFFGVGIMVITLIISLFLKNYTFSARKVQRQEKEETVTA